MRKFKFDKPLVESSTAPSTIDVYWVDKDEVSGKLTCIKEYQNGQWVNILESVDPVDPQELMDLLTYGVRWTKEDILESPVLERVGNAVFHKELPIQNAFKGCVAKQATIQYYLDPEDWSKKEDGTASVLDGTDGTVRVHTPKFYLKSWSYYDRATEKNVREVRISLFQFDKSWKEIPECVIDAYCPTLHIGDVSDLDTFEAWSVNVQNANNLTNYIGGQFSDWYNRGDGDYADLSPNDFISGKIYTNSDARLTDYGKPLTGLRRATARIFAQHAGSELLSYFIYKALYWCMVIEYATFDLMMPINDELTVDGFKQGGIGFGLRNGSNCFTEGGDYGDANGGGIYTKTSYTNGYSRYGSRTPNGWTDEIGNGTGYKVLFAAGTTVGTASTPLVQDVCAYRWRGFENFCGDQYIFLDGWITGFLIKNGDDEEIYSDDISDYENYDSEHVVGWNIFITEKSECLDDTLANKEIVFSLPQYISGSCGVSDYLLGDSADMICTGEGTDEDYHIGMCDAQYYPNDSWNVDTDNSKIYKDSDPWERWLLRCGAYSYDAGPFDGPGYFNASDDLGDAVGDLGFRTLNRIIS